MANTITAAVAVDSVTDVAVAVIFAVVFAHFVVMVITCIAATSARFHQSRVTFDPCYLNHGYAGLLNVFGKCLSQLRVWKIEVIHIPSTGKASFPKI